MPVDITKQKHPINDLLPSSIKYKLKGAKPFMRSEDTYVKNCYDSTNFIIDNALAKN